MTLFILDYLIRRWASVKKNIYFKKTKCLVFNLKVNHLVVFLGDVNCWITATLLRLAPENHHVQDWVKLLENSWIFFNTMSIVRRGGNCFFVAPSSTWEGKKELSHQALSVGNKEYVTSNPCPGLFVSKRFADALSQVLFKFF